MERTLAAEEEKSALVSVSGTSQQGNIEQGFCFSEFSLIICKWQQDFLTFQINMKIFLKSMSQSPIMLGTCFQKINSINNNS
jgi:hypothetical protein